MNVTKALKQWLVDAGLAAADACDEDLAKAAAGALVSGRLSGAEYVKLTADPDDAAAREFGTKMDRILDAVTSQGKRLEALETRSTSTAETEKPAAASTSVKERSQFDRLFAGADGGNSDGTPTIRVRGVTAKSQSAVQIVRDRSAEWFKLESWTGTSINAVNGGAAAQSLPLPVVVTVAALLLSLIHI